MRRSGLQCALPNLSITSDVAQHSADIVGNQNTGPYGGGGSLLRLHIVVGGRRRVGKVFKCVSVVCSYVLLLVLIESIFEGTFAGENEIIRPQNRCIRNRHGVVF